MNLENECLASILIIEPFYGGSHKQLVNLLTENLGEDSVKTYTLPAKKWHWRARTSALYFSQNVAHSSHYRVLLCSSVLNLSELTALRPDLSRLKKVVYFHENQLVYPVRKQQDRDFQYGYNEILSSMVADKVVFNSQFNLESFCDNIASFLKLIPDHRPKGIADLIRPKCSVIYFPIMYEEIDLQLQQQQQLDTLRQQLRSNNSRELLPQADDGGGGNAAAPQKIPDVPHAGSQPLVIGQEYLIQYSNSRKVIAIWDGKFFKMEGQEEKENGARENSQPMKKIKAAESADLHEESTESKQVTEAGQVNAEASLSAPSSPDRPLHIVWPHRWEHDKNPELLFNTLTQLCEEGLQFHVSVLGETFTDVPEIFEEARQALEGKILNWGYLSSKGEYYRVLKSADIVVSTAVHEFFGVAMLEAVYCGCFPLCPNKLVYPEIMQHDKYLYNTDNQLLKKLRQFCIKPHLVRSTQVKVDMSRFSWETLKPQFLNILEVT